MVSTEIRVWDILVRTFHWSLVVAFAIAYLTGDEENNLHIYSGYAVLGLIVFRVFWGFVGTRYARFRSFPVAPRTVFQYVKSLIAKKPLHYLGHNPAASWMVLTMLLTLFVVTVSGLKVYAIEEGLGPLAGNSHVPSINDTAVADSDDGDSDGGEHDDDEEEEFWEEIHEVSSNLLLLLIFLHLSGVIVSSRLHDERLVKAMFTGNKVSKTDAGAMHEEAAVG